MPLYEYLCPDCDEVFEEYFKLSEDSSRVKCKSCQVLAPKIMSAPAVHIFQPHYDLGLGEQVDSAQEREQIAKARNLTPI